MKRLVTSLVFVVLFSGCVKAGPREDYLLNLSVTVKTPRGTGSGNILVDGKKAYVITAGHVLTGLNVKDKVECEQTLFKNGKEIGSLVRKAKVISISPMEESGGIDLGLLELVGGPDTRPGIVFNKDDSLEIGQEIHHVGSLYGELTNSYIKGYVARMDWDLLGSSFNIVNLNGRPGSSGGGIFIKDKDNNFKYAGMVVRGDSGGIMLVKPVEVIKQWLKDIGHEELIK